MLLNISHTVPVHTGILALHCPDLHFSLELPTSMNPGLQDSTPVQLELSPSPDTVPLGSEGGTQESEKNEISYLELFSRFRADRTGF